MNKKQLSIDEQKIADLLKNKALHIESGTVPCEINYCYPISYKCLNLKTKINHF